MGRPRKQRTPLKREWYLNDGTKITIEGPSSQYIQATGTSVFVSMDEIDRTAVMPVMPVTQPDPRDFPSATPQSGGDHIRSAVGLGSREQRAADIQGAELKGVGLDLNGLDSMVPTPDEGDSDA